LDPIDGHFRPYASAKGRENIEGDLEGAASRRLDFKVAIMGLLNEMKMMRRHKPLSPLSLDGLPQALPHAAHQAVKTRDEVAVPTSSLGAAS
jgi:hypothetical protein